MLSLCLLYIKGQGLNFRLEGLVHIKEVRADEVRHGLDSTVSWQSEPESRNWQTGSNLCLPLSNTEAWLGMTTFYVSLAHGDVTACLGVTLRVL